MADDIPLSSALRAVTLSPQVFPFLQLPTELRDAIYEICLDFTFALGLVNSNSEPPPRFSGGRVSFDWRSTPSILLCSWKIHKEAVQVLYRRQFEINRGCTPRIMLGSFSKAFLQRLTRVTINIDLGEDAQWGPDRSSGAFQGLLMLLGVVWDQSHRLENLTINLSGSMAGHRGIDICEYLFSLFYPLKKVANIPNVVIKRYLDDENVTPTERANLEYDLEAYLQMLKRDNVTTPEAEGLSLFYLKCPGDVRYDHGTATLLFSAFVRWWLLAKQGCTLEKFQELPQGTSSTYFRRLKRTWDVRSWRSLPLEPTQEECAEEPNVLADPVAEELGWIPPGYEY